MGAEVDASARNRLLDALAAGAKVIEAAKAAGYTKVHAYRLLKDAGFKRELEKRRGKAAGSRSHEDVELGLDVLRQVASGKAKGSPQQQAVRVKAAQCLLTPYQRLLERRSQPATTPEKPVIKLVEGGAGSAAAADAWLKTQGKTS